MKRRPALKRGIMETLGEAMTERERFFQTRGPWNDPELARLERIRENLARSPDERLKRNILRLKHLKVLHDARRVS